MPRFNNIQNAFVSGEISPKLQGRTDIREYLSGVDRLENFAVMREGGATKRPGTEVVRQWNPNVAGTFDGDDFIPNKNTAIIPYIVNSKEAFLVFLTPQEENEVYVYILDTNTFTSQFVDTQNVATWFGFFEDHIDNIQITSDGWDYIQFGQNLIITHQTGLVMPFIVSRRNITIPFGTGHDTTRPNFPAFFVTPYVTQYTAGNIQGEDPRFSTIGDPSFFIGGTLQVPYTSLGATGGISVKTSSITLNAAATVTATPAIGGSGEIFFKQPVGYAFSPYHFWIQNDATGGTVVIEITGITSGTVATGIVRMTAFAGGAFSINTNYSTWKQSHWGGNNFWPRTITLYQQRMIFGGSIALPDTIWCSFAGNPWLMAQQRIDARINVSLNTSLVGYGGDPTEADAFDVSIGSDRISRIRWITSGEQISIGTTSEEYIFGNVDQFFSSNNSFIAKQTSKGSGNTLPVVAEGMTLFVSSDGKRLYQYGSSDRNSRFAAKNLTILADHIVNHGADDTDIDQLHGDARMRKMVWQASQNIMWILTSLNAVVGLTLDLSGGVTAWHKHTFNLPFPKDNATDLVVVPDSSGTHDSVYAMISQDIEAPAEDQFWLVKLGHFSEQNTLDLAIGRGAELRNQINVQTGLASVHNFLDASVVCIFNGSDQDDLDDLVNPRIIGTIINDPFFDVTDGRHIIDMRWMANAAVFNTDKIWEGFQWGHPISFQDTGDPQNIPAELNFETVYYMIPMYRVRNGFDLTVDNEDSRYQFRLATTLANALAGVYIAFSAAINEVSPLAFETDGFDPGQGNFVNVPHMQADAGETIEMHVTHNGKHLGPRPVDEWGRCDLGIPFHERPLGSGAEGMFENYAIIGFPYISTIKTLDLHTGSQLGTGLEAIGRIDRIMPLLYKSKDLHYGTSDTVLDEVEFDSDSDLLETKRPIVFLPQNPDPDVHVLLVSDRPFPCTVLAMVMRGQQMDS